MAVNKRGDAWTVTLSYTDRERGQIRVHETDETRDEAEERQVALKKEIREGRHVKDKVLFSKVWALYLEHSWKSATGRNPTKQERTVKCDKNACELHILPAFGPKRIAEITFLDVQRFMDDFRTRNSSGYCETMRRIIWNVIACAEKNRLVSYNVLKGQRLDMPAKVKAATATKFQSLPMRRKCCGSCTAHSQRV